METTFILTAEMDDDSFAWLDGLRRTNFPPERNFLPAHLTLFHRLSSVQVSRLRYFDAPAAPIELYFERIKFLGHGVAIHVRAPVLLRLREAARDAVAGELSRQDSRLWQPHVTIQNKVPAETARQLQQNLLNIFTGRAGEATGLLVWEYLGGPWKLVDRVAFGS
jgi:2'-5' RNA ligase